MLPPPPSMQTMQMPNDTNNNGSNLDATRQYYEARMREHAMEYANAAAGAVWAAARIACGRDNPHGSMHPPPAAGFMGQSSYYYYTLLHLQLWLLLLTWPWQLVSRLLNTRTVNIVASALFAK